MWKSEFMYFGPIYEKLEAQKYFPFLSQSTVKTHLGDTK